VVVHAGFIQKDTREAAYDKIKEELIQIREQMNSEGLSIALRTETMGRSHSLGRLMKFLLLQRLLAFCVYRFFAPSCYKWKKQLTR